MDINGGIEYMGGAPVTINATNGAIVNATFIIKVDQPGDYLRRWASAIIEWETHGTPLQEEFA